MSQVSKVAQTLFWGVALPIVLVGIGVGFFVSMGKQKPKPAAVEGKDTVSKLRKLPIVAVGKVEGTQSLKSLDVSVSGSVVPFRQINLAVEVAGRVRMKSDRCQIGRFVSQGDVLFELDPTDLELEVERLQAMKESEQAQQIELDQEISNAKRSLVLAEEELTIMEKEIQRLASLAKGFASDAELDTMRRQRVGIANQRLNVQNQLQMAETRRSRLKSAERLAVAQLQQAMVNLQRTKIVSPIDGVIVTESVQTDSFVQRGDTLCVIEDTRHVEVSCNLRSDQLLLLLQQKNSEGDSSHAVTGSSYELPNTPVTVHYRVAGRDEVVFEWRGHLSRYEGVGLDAQSRTIPIRIRVDNPREVFQNGVQIYEKSDSGLPALVRGMFVECHVHTTPPANTVLIPKLGLKPGNQVWKFEADNSIVANEEPKTLEDASLQPIGDRSIEEPKKPSKNAPININADEWAAGRIQVVSNVKVINLITHGPNKEEFWVAECKELVLPGDQVVVSPLANVVGDGNDQVRFSTVISSSDQATKE